MFCENCGKKIEEGEQFCPNCGQKVSAEEREYARTPEETEIQGHSDMKEYKGEQQGGKKPDKRKKGKAGLIAALAVLLIAILILAAAFAIFFLKKKEEEAQQEAKKQEEIEAKKEEKEEKEKQEEKEAAKREEREETEKAEEKELPEPEPTGIATGLTYAGEEIYMADFTVSASSVLKESGYNYETENLTDLDASTCWADGVAGNGTNESILFTSSQKQAVRGLAVLPGFCASADLYAKNGAPIAFHIEYGEESMDFSYVDRELPFHSENPFDGMIYIDFGETVEISECKVTITDVRDGNKYDDCCITEMFLYQ